MTQMWVMWWPNAGSASTAAGAARNSAAVVSSDHRGNATAPPPANCCGLGKFLVKLKRRSKMLVQRRRVKAGGQIGASKTRWHYDPRSYSLNFDDTSVNGNLLDQDYYQFHAFSSRYAAANPGAACQRMQIASSH